MKTRTILSTILAALLVASLSVPAVAGQTKTQAKNQFKKAGTATSGQGTMTQDRVRLKDGSCQD